MNEFDLKAAEWDKQQMHRERAEAVAAEIVRQIPLDETMTAMEFGAGTGLLSFMLKDRLKEITLIDNSEGMVKVLNEKLKAEHAVTMKAVKADLEREDLLPGSYDFIYNLMVLHHVGDVETVVKKFNDMLNPGGYLAIADLYREDGSFHGADFSGHKGFDRNDLAQRASDAGFTNISFSSVLSISKSLPPKDFSVFLMVAEKR